MNNDEITLEHLLKLCRYGTNIRVVAADTGKTIIQCLNSLANSKDKRQAAKWKAFRSVPVHCIYPDVIMADLKRRISDHIPFCITASIFRIDYKEADERLLNILREGNNEQDTHNAKKESPL